MPNPYYDHTSGLPTTQTRAVSSQARAEFDSVAVGFDDVYAEILALAAAVGIPVSVSEVPVASSATTDIGNGYGPVIQITGTNPITSFGANYKGAIFCRTAASLILTHSASLVCPGAQDITTQPGDAFIAIPIGNPGSGWRIAAYCRMSLTLLDDVAVRTSSTYADPAWLTSLAWSKITGLPTTLAGYGITDAPTKTGTGASGSWGIDITGSAAQLGGMAAGAYLQKLVPILATVGGTATAITATQAPATSGAKWVALDIVTGNGGAATTLAVNGDAAKNVKAYDATGAKVNAATVAGQRCLFMDDGTDWVLVNPLPASGGPSPNFANASAQVAHRAGMTINLSTTPKVGQCDNIGMWASAGAVSAGTLTQITTAISGTTGYAARAAGVTLTGAAVLSQSIRMDALDAKKYKNKTASFQVKVDHDVGSGVNYTLAVNKANAANNFASVTNIATSSATSVATATGTTLTFNGVAVGDCSNGLELEVRAACGAVTNKNFNVTEFKIEVAAAASAYQGAPFEEELARCERYCESSYDTGSGPGTVTENGAFQLICPGNVNRVYGSTTFRTKKLAVPTVALYSTTGAAGFARDITAAVDAAVATTSIGQSGFTTSITVGISAVTDIVLAHFFATCELF